MATTTNLNLTKPVVGADSDVWGGELNTDLDTLDAMLGGVIYGLTLSTAGSSATFGIAAGAASGMALASAYTKTTGAWALGSGNGALDTGTIANGTWYHVWLIQRTDTGVVDVLISTSATSPTMPTNYTRKRRIGSMCTTASAQWTAFLQDGDDFYLANSSLAAAAINVTISTVQGVLTVFAPLGVRTTAFIRGFAQNASGGAVLLSATDDANTATDNPSGNNTCSWTSTASNAPFSAQVRTNTASQINQVAGGASTLLRCVTYGWRDSRGKN